MCRDAILKGVITVHAPGDQLRDLVHVDDVIKAIHLAPDGLWGVRTGHLVGINDLALHIQALSGAEIRYLPATVTGIRTPTDDSTQITEIDYRFWKSGVDETFQWFKKELSDGLSTA